MNKEIAKLKRKIEDADVVVIGAGAGFSTAAGFHYGGSRFQEYFSDFEKAYGFHDMYSGVFYPYKTLEEYWGYFSRLIYINRYVMPPVPVYQKLLNAVQGKEYFVLSTNVDHCFQRAGFDKSHLFYTQGDYGLLQCSEPCHQKTYDNKTAVFSMLEATGFLAKDGEQYIVTKRENWNLKIPAELVPYCPVCGKPMTMNLRGDDTFVEDKGWHSASNRYTHFLQSHTEDKVLFLELGVGMNTPGIIKYPFWKMTHLWKDAAYACVNMGQAVAPREILSKSICINEGIETVLDELLSLAGENHEPK